MCQLWLSIYLTYLNQSQNHLIPWKLRQVEFVWCMKHLAKSIFSHFMAFVNFLKKFLFQVSAEIMAFVKINCVHFWCKKIDAIHFPTLRQHATSPSKFLKIKLVVVAMKLPPIWDNNPASRQMSEQNRKKFWEFMKVIKWVKTNFARYFIHQTNSTCLNSHGIKWFCDWLRYVRYMDNQSWHINCGTPCSSQKSITM